MRIFCSSCIQIQPIFKDFPESPPSKGTDPIKERSIASGNTSTGIKRPHRPESKGPLSKAQSGKEEEHPRKGLKECSLAHYFSIGNYTPFLGFFFKYIVFFIHIPQI